VHKKKKKSQGFKASKFKGGKKREVSSTTKGRKKEKEPKFCGRDPRQGEKTTEKGDKARPTGRRWEDGREEGETRKVRRVISKRKVQNIRTRKNKKNIGGGAD